MFQKDQRVRVTYPDKTTRDGTYSHWDAGKGRHAVWVGEMTSRRLDLFPAVMVQALHEITDEAVTAHGVKHAPEIVRLLQEGMKALFRDEHVVPVRIDPPEEGIVCVGYGLTIDPCRVETRSIVGVHQHAGWQVTTWTTQYNYPHAPDDVVDCAEGEARTPHDIARMALEVLWKNYSAQHWERVGLDAWVDQMSKEEEIRAGYQPD